METKNRVMSFDEFEASLQGGSTSMDSPEEVVDFEGTEILSDSPESAEEGTEDSEEYEEEGAEEEGAEEGAEEEGAEEESDEEGAEEIEDLDEE